MSMYEEVKTKLREWQEITVVTRGRMGGLDSLQTLYSHCENEPDEADAVRLFHHPDGKSSNPPRINPVLAEFQVMQTVYDTDSPLVIYDGYVDIDIAEVVERSGKVVVTVKGMVETLLRMYPDYIVAVW